MSVTAAKGFRASGVAAGLKSTGARDVALVVNDGPQHTAAAVFTANRVEAAPVTWSRQAVANGQAEAVVLNSGGANACTGPEGFADTHRTAEFAADELGLSSQDVLVCSTGLIGERLKMTELLRGLGHAKQSLGSDPADGNAAAEAIMTTDSHAKTVKAVSPDGVVFGGMAKGAGMLAPQLATMLVAITTDAVMDADQAARLLADATARTFDRIDSDACMSTNDTVILLASGASGVALDDATAARLLGDVSSGLARQLIGDAEGASHDIAVTVTNASSESAAVAVAREVCRSSLFKTAVFGNDPNWGRIVAAVGGVDAETAPYDPQQLDVSVNGVQVCRGLGVAADRSEVDMTPRETRVEIDLHAGEAEATVWTNDLTHEYVHENSAYSS